MRKIIVKSLPIADVIKNLADEMNCSYINYCSLYKLDIPEEYGKGTIIGIQFTSGFAMLNYDCQFNESIAIHFTFNQVHPIKFIHCHQGETTHYFEGGTKAHSVVTYENIVVASRKENGHILEFTAGIPTKLCSVEIDRNAFYDKIDCLLSKENGELVDAISDKKGIKQYYKKGKYSLAITSIISEITSIDEFALSSILLKEGQCYAMLSYQWLEFSDSENQSIIDRFEYQTFLNLIGYIKLNIHEPLTVKLLSQKFLVSDKKIQKLFRSFAKKTVNKYLQDYRLEKSLELLTDPNNNISEVVYQLGLKNRSYFTRIFKDRYDLTPSKFISNIMTK